MKSTHHYFQPAERRAAPKPAGAPLGGGSMYSSNRGLT